MFTPWTQEQYRSADLDALEVRKEELADELTNPKSEVPTDEIEKECKLIEESVERIRKAADLRERSMKAVAGGAGRIVERKLTQTDAVKDTDPYDSKEYRKAFMDYVCRGVAMPAQYRTSGTVSEGTTLTSDIAPQIPTTMQKDIIHAMREYGNIWNEVRKLNVQGGTWFRVVDIVPTATWLQENNVSKDQKITADEKVSFSFFELECRMAQSLLTSAVTPDDFQAMFVPAVAEAMVKALEQAIVSGDGTTQPLGITVDPRVITLQDNDPRKAAVVEMTAEQFGDWKQWRAKVKSVIPSRYRNGKFYMSYSTFDCYIETMSDDNSAPVSTDFNPVTGVEQSRLCGMDVVKTADDILPDFDSAQAGDVVAIYGNMNNYAVNTQPKLAMNTVRWVDHNTNEEKIKSLMAVDGKVLDPYGFIVIKKKASA